MTTSFTDGTSVFAPFAVQPFSSTAQSQNIFHPVVGSPNPDVTLMAAALPTGTFVAGFVAEADATGFVAMLSQASTFQVSSDDWTVLNLSFVLNGSLNLALDPDSRAFWTVTVDYQAVPSA